METKLDSRQGQFPASFPDTFKDFFAMMSEDEDHLDLFSNLLEDKVIPRSGKYTQRRCGGSLRCPNTSNINVGRSNSFRVNRPVNNYCKHIKYCCLHRKQYSQNVIDFGYTRSNDNDVQDGVQKLKTTRSSLLERTFECESCEESDTISTSSSTATIPYNAIGRQSHQQQQQQHHPHPHSQHYHQTKGFIHSKDSLPRIVKQCGLREDISGIIVENNPGGSGVGVSVGSTIGSNFCGTGSSIAAVNSNNSNSSNVVGTGIRPPITTTMYSDISASSLSSTQVTMSKCFSDKLNPCTRPSSIRPPKSPVLNRRRASSIAATLLVSDNKMFRNAEDSAWVHSIPHSSTRERLSHAKSPVNSGGAAGIHSSKGKVPVTESGVLSFKQAMSGAVSPQFPPTSISSLMGGGSSGIVGGCGASGSGDCGSYTPTTNTTPVSSTTSGTVTPTSITTTRVEGFFTGSVAAISQMAYKQKQRMRTSSMPAESRKPRLADTRRAAIHCADMDIEYYRLRSFSITSHGICNLGDSLRSRRSRSINSVTSTGTSNSGRDRNNSNASRASGDILMGHEQGDGGIGGDGVGEGGGGGGKSGSGRGEGGSIPAYKIAMLGASGVGKTALTYQFTTSDYICAYDLSLDDDYGQKTVSVLLDGVETDLEIIDHPACEMSTEAFCSTYNIDLFVVVYSVVDRNSFKSAEKILHYLKDSEMLLTRGAILVGNKTDLERHREVTRQTGRKLAKEIACKFIETSSGLDHNVDELLVGIVAQVKLNPQRIHNLSEKDRQRLNITSALQKHRRKDHPPRKFVKQQSICLESGNNLKILSTGKTGSKTEKTGTTTTPTTTGTGTGIGTKMSGPIKKSSKRTLNLESILKVGESEIDDNDDDGYRPDYTRKELTKKKDNNNSEASCSSSPKSRNSYDNQDLSQNVTNLVDDSKKAVSKISNRTKIFLSSVLKFKKALNVKRRSSSNCSDLFVI